jgi:hypothetical protein
VTAQRSVTVATADHGPVTIPEPRWCIADHCAGVSFRADVTHRSRTFYVHMRTPRGVAELLSLEVAERPFSQRPGGRRPYIAVVLADVEGWETRLPGVFLFALRLLLAVPRIVVAAVRVGVEQAGGER